MPMAWLASEPMPFLLSFGLMRRFDVEVVDDVGWICLARHYTELEHMYSLL